MLVAAARVSRVLMLALVAWMVFGGWALFRPDPDVPGLDPVVGHVVVFFFVSVAAFGLLVGRFGVRRGLVGGTAAAFVVAVVSEVLQPIVTETRLAQRNDLVGNGAGIVGALLVSLVLVAVLRRPVLRDTATALICAAGLLGSVVVVQVGADELTAFYECLGKRLDPIDSVPGGPIISVNEQSVRFGAVDPVLVDDGIIQSNSTDFRCSVIRSGSYSVVATVVPSTTEVGGPMRIFTSSVSTQFNEENTHLGQEFDALSVRVRSGGALQWESVPDVFVAEERVTVAMVVGNGQIDVLVDGEHRATFELESDTFAEWNESYPMLIGDEFTRDRTFEGAIESVLVFDRILVEGDAALASSND